MLGRRYVRIFIIINSEPGYGPESMYNDPAAAAYGMQIGATYAFGEDEDTVATLTDLDFEETENAYIWYATGVYDTDRIISAVTDDPLAQPPVIDYGGTTQERPLVIDFNGVSVVNSSGDRFDPPFTFEEKRPLISITRNESSYNKDDAIAYQNAVNDATWNGIDPYCAKLNIYQGTLTLQNGIQFYSVRYEIEIRREGFFEYALDQGFRDIDGNLFRDPRDQTPLSNPTLLNGKGRKLASAISTLDGAILAADTTLDIRAGDLASFPDDPSAAIYPQNPSGFNIRIDDEVMTVTAISSTTFTVTRGVAGTTAANHADNADVEMEPYYLIFFPSKQMDFSALSLPAF